MSFDRLFGQRRHASRNLAVNWNIGDPNFHGRRDQSPCFSGVSIEETLTLQRGDVLHNRSLARASEMTLDCPRAWRHSFFPLFALYEIENISLTVRKHSLSWIKRNPAQVQMNSC